MRTVTVFFSCPADVIPARDELTKVVYEVAEHFRRFDITVSPWRYDHQALPGVGGNAQRVVNEQLPDYDVYVGLLCGRLGTPTDHALSGTVEEFLDAKKRCEETNGRPAMLFYFCNGSTAPDDPDQRAQWEKVRDFRRLYPGLSASFDSVEQLRVMFKDHLIDLLLREIHHPAPPPRVWLPLLGAQLDASGGGGEYLDRSSAATRRIFEKLRGLVDLETTLLPTESDALLAAILLRAHILRGADDTPARAILRDAKGADSELEAAAVAVAERAGAEPEDLSSGEMKVGNVRCHFLAALLQLGELLDRDHASIAGAPPPAPPGPSADLACWLAYYTRRIAVQRPGIVTFHLQRAVADAGAASVLLTKCVTLTFELEWQRRRRILTANGVTVGRAPSSTVGSPRAAPLTESLRARLAAAVKDAAARLPELLHLSETSNRWPGVETLLPLPTSAVLAGFQLRWDRGRYCEVILRPQNGDGSKSTLVATDVGEAFVDAAALAPAGSRHMWELSEDLGGFTDVLAYGEAWTLSPNEHLRWAAVADMGNDEARQSLRMSLSLWNDLLVAAWPRLAAGTARCGEAALAYDVLLASYEWLREHAPGSGQVDRIRNVTRLVRDALLELPTQLQ